MLLLASEDPGAGGAGPDLSSAYRSQAAEDAKGAEGAKAWAEGAGGAADTDVLAGAPPGLAAPAEKDLAQQLVASAENSTLDWRSAYAYIFRKAQDTARDRVYFDPAVRLAKLDGLGPLGQFVYDTSRVDTAQRRFLDEGNLDLRTPLEWQVYGETYKVP
nr:chitosanase [Streptomyces sp. SID5470]